MSAPTDATMLTVAETGSTNADLLELARARGAAEGTWLRAERQTAGRGRHGREWVSPKGNLYASALVRLQRDDPPAPTLALVAAVALATSAHRLGAHAVRIKWPNDLMSGRAKVAGILLERADDWVVIGAGVNLASAPQVPGRETGRLDGIAPDNLLDLLAGEFARWTDRWRRDGVAAIADAWCARAHPIGTPLTVALPDREPLVGTFAGLAADGALRLALGDGTERVVHAGDVFLI